MSLILIKKLGVLMAMSGMSSFQSSLVLAIIDIDRPSDMIEESGPDASQPGKLNGNGQGMKGSISPDTSIRGQAGRQAAEGAEGNCLTASPSLCLSRYLRPSRHSKRTCHRRALVLVVRVVGRRHRQVGNEGDARRTVFRRGRRDVPQQQAGDF